jgi:hypothetical protein
MAKQVVLHAVGDGAGRGSSLANWMDMASSGIPCFTRQRLLGAGVNWCRVMVPPARRLSVCCGTQCLLA